MISKSKAVTKDHNCMQNRNNRERTQKRLLSLVSYSQGGTYGTTAVHHIWLKRNTVKLPELDFDFLSSRRRK
jgi:hypothetical protein